MYCSVVAFLTAEVGPPDDVVAALLALGRPCWCLLPRWGSEAFFGTVDCAKGARYCVDNVWAREGRGMGKRTGGTRGERQS